MIVWVLIVVVVIAILVFITIKTKGVKPENTNVSQVEQNTNMENTQQAEGVKVAILQEGAGEAAKSGDLVAMNYTGRLVDGTVFDSNVDPKFNHVEPFEFTLGAGQVIPGWDIGVSGMKAGEKRILEIAPDYAYGATGAGGVIPPNATLIFEVELLEIK